jgi:phage/plasmid primase-like uncharacterized protein
MYANHTDSAGIRPSKNRSVNIGNGQELAALFDDAPTKGQRDNWNAACPHCDGGTKKKHLSLAVIPHKKTGEPIAVGHCWKCQDKLASLLPGIGLTLADLRVGSTITPAAAAAANAQDDEDAIAHARQLNGYCELITEHSNAAKYLRNRAITDHSANDIRGMKSTLMCKQWTSALAGLITDYTGALKGIVRVAINSDGAKNPKIDKSRQKMNNGRVKGYAVRLDAWEPGKRLVLCEGLETALSVRQRTRELGRDCVVWSCLSAHFFEHLKLPDDARRILIAGDNDRAGREGAEAAARKWRREGRQVSITYPNTPHVDFNDVAVAAAGKIGGAA